MRLTRYRVNGATYPHTKCTTKIIQCDPGARVPSMIHFDFGVGTVCPASLAFRTMLARPILRSRRGTQKAEWTGSRNCLISLGRAVVQGVRPGLELSAAGQKIT
jgi:hypothetical protein